MLWSVNYSKKVSQIRQTNYTARSQRWTSVLKREFKASLIWPFMQTWRLFDGWRVAKISWSLFVTHLHWGDFRCCCSIQCQVCSGWTRQERWTVLVSHSRPPPPLTGSWETCFGRHAAGFGFANQPALGLFRIAYESPINFTQLHYYLINIGLIYQTQYQSKWCILKYGNGIKPFRKFRQINRLKHK